MLHVIIGLFTFRLSVFLSSTIVHYKAVITFVKKSVLNSTDVKISVKRNSFLNNIMRNTYEEC
jgi:hypothetical protein